MDIGLVLDEKLSHFFTPKCACEHERRPSILISLLNIGAQVYQAAYTSEFVVLDCQRNRRPSVLVDWIHVGTLTDHSKDGVERAINCRDVDKRALRVQSSCKF